MVVFYLLLISLSIFSPFFLYHARSSCFPNPDPRPLAFPGSFFGSHLASISSLTDKTHVFLSYQILILISGQSILFLLKTS